MSSSAGRIESLDQFRGYTVVGMLAVNFLGSYAAVPAILKHHNTYCSYADTIMPQFFFAVGFAYRLTFLRRRQREGTRAAVGHAWWRILGLLLIGLIVHRLDGSVSSWSELRELGIVGFFTTAFQREPFQALVHIAVTSLWILPVIAAGPGVRIGYAMVSALAHLALSSAFYMQWAWERPAIDGGPLAFLAWTLPMIAGTLAYDLMATRDPRAARRPLLLGAIGLMLGAYALSCLSVGGLVEPPFVPPPEGRAVDVWTMSQRTGSVTYLLFSAGFSLAVYALFVELTDIRAWKSTLFRIFGTNALIAYILHSMVSRFLKPYVPGDVPLAFVLAAWLLFMAINTVIVRHLERQGIFLKL